ncbi:MAG: acyltransferase [Spongiibacteraceae bacterium]
MTVDLNAATPGRDNHFNLIRFLAATLVLYIHCFPLTGRACAEPMHVFDLSFGQLAVAIFFVSSGFLVTGSLLRSHSIVNFFRARVVRIYPGLITANLFSVFVVGLLFTSLPAHEYLARSEIYTYLQHNSLLLFHSLQYRLPGVFEHNHYPLVVNGSLWTLPREVKLYLQLGLIGGALLWLARWRSIPLRVVLIVVVLGFACAVMLAPGQVEGHTYTRAELSLLFFFGGLTYAWRDQIRLDWRISMVVVLAMVVTALTAPSALRFVLIPALVWLVPLFAYGRCRPLLAFNRCGDYSYGVYIYAFPVQQALIAVNPDISVAGLFCQAFPIVLALAMLSWHGIEQPALRLKRRKAKKQDITGDGIIPPSGISQ